MPKAQRTRGLSSAYQSNKFLHKSWSNSKFQNSKSQPNISITTKLLLQNLDQTTTHVLLHRCHLGKESQSVNELVTKVDNDQTQVYKTEESGSARKWMTSKHSQWSDSGPIKMIWYDSFKNWFAWDCSSCGTIISKNSRRKICKHVTLVSFLLEVIILLDCSTDCHHIAYLPKATSAEFRSSTNF